VRKAKERDAIEEEKEMLKEKLHMKIKEKDG
jgi:hypothetical protein